MDNILTTIMAISGLVLVYALVSDLIHKRVENKIQFVLGLMFIAFVVGWILMVLGAGLMHDKYAVKSETSKEMKVKILNEEIIFLGEKIPIGSRVTYSSSEQKYIREVVYPNASTFKSMPIYAWTMKRYEPKIGFSNITVSYNDLAMLAGEKPAKTVLLFDMNLSSDTLVSNWSCSKSKRLIMFENKLLSSCTLSKDSLLKAVIAPKFSEVSLYNKYFKDPRYIKPVWKITSTKHPTTLTVSGFDCARGDEISFLDNGLLLSCTLANTLKTDVVDVPIFSTVSLGNEEDFMLKDFEPIWNIHIRNMSIKEEFFNDVYLKYSKKKVLDIHAKKHYKKSSIL